MRSYGKGRRKTGPPTWKLLVGGAAFVAILLIGILAMNAAKRNRFSSVSIGNVNWAYTTKSSADWQQYKKLNTDSRVAWFGYVQDITKVGEETWVKLSDEEDSSSWDFTFKLEDEDGYASTVTEGQKIKVDGRIEDMKENAEGTEPPVQIWLKESKVLFIAR